MLGAKPVPPDRDGSRTKPSPTIGYCEACIYMQPLQPHAGWCRRNAPDPTRRSGPLPWVNDNDWCGDFYPLTAVTQDERDIRGVAPEETTS